MAVAGDIVIELKLDDKDMTVNVKKAGAVLQEFQANLKQTVSSVKKLEDAQGSLGRKFHQMITTLGMMRFAVMDLNDVFLRLPMSILKSAGELEKLRILMTGLSTATSKMAKDAEGLKDFNFVIGMAKTSPFDIKAIGDSFVKLKTAGLDPTDGSMNALIDSVSRFGGSSDTLKRASVAIQQMAGKGVISMEELRQQLGEAVPTAMKAMALGMGVSVEELTKIVQTGTLKAAGAIGKMLAVMEVDNRGAATDLMKSWDGALSQLKTEWALTAEWIAKNGFADAAKDAVKKLTQALATDEFRRFGMEAGNTLTSVTSGVVSGATAIIKYRDEIVTLAEAWLVYKLVFSGVIPMAKAMEASFLLHSTQVKTTTADILMSAQVKSAAAAEEMLALNLSNRARQEGLAVAIAANEAELASLRAKNAAIIAEDMKLAARPRIKSLADLGEALAGVQRMKDLSTQSTVLNAKQSELQGTVALLNTEMKASATAAATKTAALHAVANASTLSRAGIIAATAATTAFNAAMSLVGGPVGLFVITLMGLAYWWSQAGKEAEESAERQARAGARLSTAKDELDIADALRTAKRRERLAGLDAGSRTVSTDEVGDVMRNKTAKEMLADQEALKSATASRIALETQQVNAEVAVKSQTARLRVNVINNGIQDVIDSAENASAREMASIVEEGKKKLTAVKDNAAATLSVEIQITKEKFAANKVYYEVLTAAREAGAASLRKSALNKPAGSNDAIAELKAANDQEEKLATLREKQKGFLDRVAAKIESKPKIHVGPAQNVQQTYIGNMREQNERLKVEVAGLATTVGVYSEVEAAMKQLEQRFKSGDFKLEVRDKDQKLTGHRDPTEKEKIEIREVTKTHAELTVAKTDLQTLAAEVNNMQPEIAHAAKILLDPLGTVNEKKENKFQKRLEHLKGMSEDLKAGLEKAGLNWSDLMRKAEAGMAGAGKIDMAAALEVTAAENKKLSFEIIEDDRLRTRLQMQFDNDLTATRAANVVKNALANKVSAADIATLEAEQVRGAALHAEKMRQAIRTPMEKMADDWQKSMHKMEDASASWAGSFVDMVVTSAKTGKLEFGSLVQSILADILKIQLQKSLGDPLKDIIKAGTDKLGEYMPDLTNNVRGAAVGIGKLGSLSTKDALSEFAPLEESVEKAAESLSGALTPALSDSVAQMLSSTASQAQQASVTGFFSSSISSATASVYEFIAALSSMAGSSGSLGGLFGSGAGKMGNLTDSQALSEFAPLAFAKGGILDSLGSVPLRKYAAGGIARSPQLALYGEAGPEAYVPLPDGRSIPVTLNTGTAAQQGVPNVTVNVINQTTQQVSSQQSQPRFDGKQMILDIVLSAATSPGPFRTGMKGAIS